MSGTRQVEDKAGNTWVVVESPRYFDGNTGQKVLDVVKKLVDGGVIRIAFDMTETQVVNSVGVSRLIEIVELCDGKAGGVVFCTTRPILLDAGARKFVLNLAKSRIINSIGISILIEVIEKVRGEEGSVAFCQVTPTIEKTFRIMGLMNTSTVHGTEEEAVAHLTS